MTAAAADRDKLAMHGEVVIELVNVVTGEKRYVREHNALTTSFLERIVDWINGGSVTAPTHIAVATGAAASYDDSNVDTDKTLKSTGADSRLAQGFQLSSSYTVNAVYLRLKRIGTSPGNLYVDICADSSGDPSTVLATSDPVTINGLGTTEAWVRFSFSTTVALSASTQYHIVLRSTGYTYSAATTEVVLGIDTSSAGYASGSLRTYDGSTWSAHSPAADAAFRVIVVPGASFTDVVDEIDRNAISSTSEQSSTTARLLAFFSAAEAVDTICMIGLFDAAAAGTLLAVAAVNVTKTNQEQLNVYWTVAVASA